MDNTFSSDLALLAQELRKKLESERGQKEQFERQLQTVKDEVSAALHAAQQDAAAAQEQVRHETDLLCIAT